MRKSNLFTTKHTKITKLGMFSMQNRRVLRDSLKMKWPMTVSVKWKCLHFIRCGRAYAHEHFVVRCEFFINDEATYRGFLC